MKLMPKGDYYIWYCDWCDSRNLTIWMKMEANSFCCAACQREFVVDRDGRIHGADDQQFLQQAV